MKRQTEVGGPLGKVWSRCRERPRLTHYPTRYSDYPLAEGCRETALNPIFVCVLLRARAACGGALRPLLARWLPHARHWLSLSVFMCDSPGTGHGSADLGRRRYTAVARNVAHNRHEVPAGAVLAAPQQARTRGEGTRWGSGSRDTRSLARGIDRCHTLLRCG